MRIQYEYTQTQCDEGTRDGIDIWYIGIILAFLIPSQKIKDETLVLMSCGMQHAQLDHPVDIYLHGKKDTKSN